MSILDLESTQITKTYLVSRLVSDRYMLRNAMRHPHIDYTALIPSLSTHRSRRRER
jgi:hypothetical protein